jgi:PEP-CTERM motif
VPTVPGGEPPPVPGPVDPLPPVNPIPEPETYALMLAGLAAMSFVARRRRAQIDR